MSKNSIIFQRRFLVVLKHVEKKVDIKRDELLEIILELFEIKDDIVWF